jgi:hypothetical protein
MQLERWGKRLERRGKIDRKRVGRERRPHTHPHPHSHTQIERETHPQRERERERERERGERGGVHGCVQILFHASAHDKRLAGFTLESSEVKNRYTDELFGRCPGMVSHVLRGGTTCNFRKGHAVLPGLLVVIFTHRALQKVPISSCQNEGMDLLLVIRRREKDKHTPPGNPKESNTASITSLPPLPPTVPRTMGAAHTPGNILTARFTRCAIRPALRVFMQICKSTLPPSCPLNSISCSKHKHHAVRPHLCITRLLLTEIPA